jgi:hypothetical protein
VHESAIRDQADLLAILEPSIGSPELDAEPA